MTDSPFLEWFEEQNGPCPNFTDDDRDQLRNMERQVATLQRREREYDFWQDNRRAALLAWCAASKQRQTEPRKTLEVTE